MPPTRIRKQQLRRCKHDRWYTSREEPTLSLTTTFGLSQREDFIRLIRRQMLQSEIGRIASIRAKHSVRKTTYLASVCQKRGETFELFRLLTGELKVQEKHTGHSSGMDEWSHHIVIHMYAASSGGCTEYLGRSTRRMKLQLSDVAAIENVCCCICRSMPSQNEPLEKFERGCAVNKFVSC